MQGFILTVNLSLVFTVPPHESVGNFIKCCLNGQLFIIRGVYLKNILFML